MPETVYSCRLTLLRYMHCGVGVWGGFLPVETRKSFSERRFGTEEEAYHALKTVRC